MTAPLYVAPAETVIEYDLAEMDPAAYGVGLTLVLTHEEAARRAASAWGVATETSGVAA